MGDYRICVPSRKRPHNMEKLQKLLGKVTVFVYRDEVDSYSTAPKGIEVLPVPPKVDNLCKKFQHILDSMSEETVVITGDDLDHVQCIIGERARHYTSSRDIVPIIENQVYICQDLGITLGGFKQTLSRFKYGLPAYDPFKVTGKVLGVYVITGREIAFDTKMTTRLDLDLSLTALLKTRVLLMDHRYIFSFGRMFANPGGLQGIRTKEAEKLNWEYLKAKWKGHVQLTQSKTTDTITIDVPRRNILGDWS